MSNAYQAPPGLHCAVLNCNIQRYTHGQQAGEGLLLSLIFDRDVPLWRHEYPEPEFVPTARVPGHSA